MCVCMCLGVLVHNIIAQKTMCRTASKQSIQLHTQHLRIRFAFGHILDIGVAITHTHRNTHTCVCSVFTQASSRGAQKKEVHDQNV